MNRLLPIFLALAIGLLFVLFTPLKTELAYKLKIAGDSTTSCCNVADVLQSNGNFDENADTAIFNGQVIDYPKTSLAQSRFHQVYAANGNVLGTKSSSGAEKWIDISLNEQKLRAFEGSSLVMEFPISSGRWFPTPTGEFNIWYKNRSQTMQGGSKELGTYYYLPNVPNNMFFYQGFAIHGAYWHNNFGHPMSHGCVNSPLTQVAQLFEWAGPILPPGQNSIRATAENPGTKVVIHS